MPPRLLLALALLGAACAGHPAPASSEAAEPAPKFPEDGVRCPRASKMFRAAHLPDATTARYIIVTRGHSFTEAQRVCAWCYGGQLASIHSASINDLLRQRSRLNCRRGLVWIGAVTQPQGQTVQCHWADRTPWDFSQWAPGYPLRSYHACTALSTHDGSWRSLCCRVPLPFICEY